MRVGVLSDTHLRGRDRPLPDALYAAFAGVDMILHAGDLNTLDVLDLLRPHAPVHAVHGNTDPWDVTHALPARLRLELGGLAVGLTHGHQGSGRGTPERALSNFSDVQVVVFGHSHMPLVEERGGVLLVNPGSPTDKRTQRWYSCAVLTIEAGGVGAEVVRW